MIGRLVRVACTAILGLALAFFVAVSGFADGAARERAITIALIALAYGFVGMAIGYRGSAWHGLGLACPALAVLTLYAVSERNWWFIAYAALVAAMATAGAYGGSRFDRGRGGPRVGLDALEG